MVRKTSLQVHLSVMKDKRLSNSELGDSDDAAVGEEAMETDGNTATTNFQSINFRDSIILNHIAVVFQLCKSKCGLKNLSCLLYMTLRYFDNSWDVSNDFLTTVGAYTVCDFFTLTSSKDSRAFF